MSNLHYIAREGLSSDLSSDNLGVCPTREHSITHPQCGFAGCVDLRLWAKANRYRFRLEESYRAESFPHVRGDGRWYVEILCKSGLIYPYGGTQLLAHAKSRTASAIAKLPGVHPYQTDGTARVFKFPVECLDEVAAILKPRKRRTLSPDRARAIGKATAYGAQVRQTDQERTQNASKGVDSHLSPRHSTGNLNTRAVPSVWYG